MRQVSMLKVKSGNRAIGRDEFPCLVEGYKEPQETSLLPPAPVRWASLDSHGEFQHVRHMRQKEDHA